MKTDHYAYHRDLARLERGVEVINLCNSLTVINDACKKTNLNKEFEFGVLYEVLAVIYSGKVFSDNELERLYDFKKNLEEFAMGMQFFSPKITEELYLDSETTLVVLGFEFDKLEEFNRLDNRAYGEALEVFYKMEDRYFKGELSLKEFKKQILKHFNDELKELKRKEQNRAA